MHDEKHEGEEGEEHGNCHGGWGGPMKKAFKLAKLEKKEKMLKAELEFVGKLKEIVAKIPEDKK